MAMDLDGVLAALSAGQAQTRDIASRMVGAYGAQKGSISQGIQAQGQVGEASRVIAEQEQRGLLNAQEDTRAAATSFGTNMDDPSQIVTLLGQDMREAYARMKAQQARVNKIEQGATLSNPLGLLTNIVIGDEERAELAGAQADFTLASNTLQALNQATQQTAATQRAIAETKSQSSVQAELDKIEANTKLAQAELKSRLAGVDVQMLGALDSLNARQTSMAIQMYNIGVQEEQRQWMRSQREAEDALKLEQKAGAEKILAAWNEGRAMQGLPPGTEADLKLSRQIDSSNVAALVAIGNQRLSGSSIVRYGAGPLDAATTIQSNRLQLPEGQQLVYGQLETWAAEASSPSALSDVGMAENNFKAQQLLSDKKNVPAIRNQYMQTKAARNLALIDPKDESNIYAPPPIDILKDKTYLLENKFLADNLAPSVEAGGNIKFNPSQLVEQAIKGVVEGTYTTSEISEGITWTAQQLAMTNNATKNYLGFGLPSITNSYNVPMVVKAGPYATSVSATVNLLDPVQVTAYLQRVIAAAPKTNKSLLELTEEGLKNSPLGGVASFLGNQINSVLGR